MISPLWLWPIWLASILLLCLFGGSTALRALLVLLPLLLAASAAVSCLASRRISLRLSSRELAPKRRGVSAELSVKNDSPFPLMQLRCRMTLENRLTGEQFTRLVAVSLPPFSSRQVSLSIGSRHCGQILLSTGRVRAADFFGLISFPVAAKGRAITTVLPNTFPLRLLTGFLNLSLEESEEYDPARAGEDVSEVHQIREYREGDALRQIHWKLTEKTGEVIVRQLGLPVNHSILLLMDNSVSAPCAPEDCEALGELTASVSAALCSAGFAHQIAWFDREEDCIATAQAESDDTLTQALAELLAAQIVPDETTTVQRWLTTRGPLNYAHVVLLTLRQEQQDVQAADGGAVTVLRAGRLDREGGVFLAL